MKTALLSVSDKTGIVDFARGLQKVGFRILSTGGTYKKLTDAGLKDILEIAKFTGFPEGLEGRIKTLTPQVFGGILNLRDNPEHQKFCQENDIENIDLVVVNLYPFKQTYEDTKKSFPEKVEQVDIGGPSMIRAAAKNYEFCAPVVDPADYQKILQEYEKKSDLNIEFRKELAAKCFEMTAHYDLLIAKFWNENADRQPLRYGENPHQSAVLLSDPFASGSNLVRAKQLNGKPMSYNNYQDANAALELAGSFAEPFACIIKHASPCCAATGKTAEEAFRRAFEEGDNVSAFGGIIAVNQEIKKGLAEQITSFFNEIVLAPAYSDEALKILKNKKNLRVLEVPNFNELMPDLNYKRIRGGTLIQDSDIREITEKDLCFVGDKKPEKKQIADLLLAWKIVKIVKSNAIVIVKDGALIGKGGGQTSRVDAMRIALDQAGEKARGAVLASDAFFPFADSVEAAGEVGIAAIIQPGGSVRDEEVFEACKKMGIITTLTQIRAFLH
ncbi:bifunctional phosphoribosylaminoimidazolecarboxamide formyltransferase/IMP cyclohydrolase [Candidatus Gracilibacteria bacterium]|nr:bifunctional phosphoribosylaminoimidazolecarboxamide formyltransferase/IMP cyclohydrolase [Candidatus Gracilibacteria bacterium]MCF7819205.1 bifunctional phosphoribosylaminoimidazolecarboxamide formyltransferase/IMP cyclohydrolase [Candidatus Gracilibacteria bacterium]